MKFSYEWLNALVDGPRQSPQDLSNLITMKTAESEGVEAWGASFPRIVVARVQHVEPVPDSKIVKAIVDIGDGNPRTVVCGAPNCRQGLLTAFVPPGVSVDGMEIRETTIRGVLSQGMLASGAELGINKDHEGILDLAEARPDTPGPDTPEPGSPVPGSPVPGCTPDFIIEIDNKSLTHRPDLWGHYGMAREVAAITGATLRDPVDNSLLPDAPCPFRIDIEDGKLAPRYSGLLVENVTVGPSPLSIQNRLSSIGLNPINNVVDITNLVMAEFGQPMHAFDADKLRGDTIYVRSARDGERCMALNDEEYTLAPTNLVIADQGGPIALAGVIGGKESAIHEGTTRIFFESANFQAANIRRTSSALKLRTDASMRFEKAQDPENTVRAIARALELLLQVCPQATVSGGVGDLYFPLPQPEPIALPHAWLERKLGRAIPQDEVARILTAIGFGVTPTSDGLHVTVPSWRATKDVSIKDDLVEEVGRMVGYASITPTPPLIPSVPPHENHHHTQHSHLRDTLRALGFSEVYNYSFITEKQVAAFQIPADQLVGIANPIAPELSSMRPSLLPGILHNCELNLRNFDDFRLFEIGREIRNRPGHGRLPEETNFLAAVICTREDGDQHLFALKRVARNLFPGALLQPDEALPHEHPFRAARVEWHGEQVGRFFEFHPNMLAARASVLYVNLDQCLRLQPGIARYRPLSRYPASGFDLSVVVDTHEYSSAIQEAIRRHAGQHLVELEFLRVYEGAPLPEGRKSLSYRLVVGARDHTFTNEEVTAIRNQVIQGLEAEGHELRL